MNMQSYIKDIRKDGRRCFTTLDIVEQFHVSNSHARVALHRLLKTGELVSPARDLYVVVPQELEPLVMQYMGAHYDVALLSAGFFHRTTHQKPAKFQVISDKSLRHSGF